MSVPQFFFEWQNRRAPLPFHDPDLMALREEVVDLNVSGTQNLEQLDTVGARYAGAAADAIVDDEDGPRTLYETMDFMDTERLLRGYLYGLWDALRVRKMHSFSTEPPVTLTKIHGWLDDGAERAYGRKLTFEEHEAPLAVPVAKFMVRKVLLTDVRAERTRLNPVSARNTGQTRFRHTA